jgi:uncharacterized protein DUF3995
VFSHVAILIAFGSRRSSGSEIDCRSGAGGGVRLARCSARVLGVWWNLGRRAALAEVDGRPRFVPARGATLAVAAALIGAAVVVLARADLILGFVPRWASQAAAGVLGAVFVLRAVGDFRLMGFFKSVRGTGLRCGTCGSTRRCVCFSGSGRGGLVLPRFRGHRG